MTNEELTAIEERANAATREPWIVGDMYVPSACLSAVSVYGMGMEVAECQMVRDGEFIAAARVDVPALVAEVRTLRAERDALRKDAARYRWLKPQLEMDWDLGNPVYLSLGLTVEVPTHVEVSFDLDATIDAALAVQP